MAGKMVTAAYAKEAPASMRAYLLEGGPAPGTFGRDLRTASNQVPRWAWATLSVLFGGMAWFAWKRTQPEKKKAALAGAS